MSLFAWLILGLIAGFIASHLVNHKGEGMVLDILLGIVGAIIGGWMAYMLGFAGDLGSGLLYLIGRLVGWGQGPVLIAIADYGTKFIVVSGLLNIVAAVDAHSLASGRKPL